MSILQAVPEELRYNRRFVSLVEECHKYLQTTTFSKLPESWSVKLFASEKRGHTVDLTYVVSARQRKDIPLLTFKITPVTYRDKFPKGVEIVYVATTPFEVHTPDLQTKLVGFDGFSHGYDAFHQDFLSRVVTSFSDYLVSVKAIRPARRDIKKLMPVSIATDEHMVSKLDAYAKYLDEKVFGKLPSGYSAELIQVWTTLSNANMRYLVKTTALNAPVLSIIVQGDKLVFADRVDTSYFRSDFAVVSANGTRNLTGVRVFEGDLDRFTGILNEHVIPELQKHTARGY